MMRRILWLWVSQDATKAEERRWQQFIKMNISISQKPRFLTAKDEQDFLTKRDILESAGWQMGRWGEAQMERLVMFTKEENDEATL
jgi:hypothetical protein